MLRMMSQQRTQNQKRQYLEMRPLTYGDVARMKEEDLQVKLCDMGNACYIDKHYSDII